MVILQLQISWKMRLRFRNEVCYGVLGHQRGSTICGFLYCMLLRNQWQVFVAIFSMGINLIVLLHTVAVFVAIESTWALVSLYFCTRRRRCCAALSPRVSVLSNSPLAATRSKVQFFAHKEIFRDAFDIKSYFVTFPSLVELKLVKSSIAPQPSHDAELHASAAGS